MPVPFDVDVIVVGMGPGGEAAASRLLAAGRRVAVVEREERRVLGVTVVQRLDLVGCEE